MNQGRIKMKAVEQPQDLTSAEDRHAALADRLLQESGYLPSQDDQSWRERAALRIAPGFERDGIGELAEWGAVEPELIVEPDPESRGRGGFLVAFFMIVVIVPVIAALTFPDILTAGFWRAQSSATHVARATPSVAASSLRAALREPTSAPPAQVAPPSRPEQLPQKIPKTVPDESGVRIIDARKPPQPPAAREASRNTAEDNQAGGFYAKVAGPDGALRSQYFPAEPTARTARHESAGKDRDASGFYAMVAGPDGTLRYKYFSSKPSQ